MKRILLVTLILLALFVLIACAGATPATAPATSQNPLATTAPSPAISPTAAGTLSPSPTPLPQAIQDLLAEREAIVREMYHTLEKAQADNASQEQIDTIIRTYVASIETIEQELVEKGIKAPPINLPPTPPVQAKKQIFDIGMVTKDRVHIQGTYYRPAATHAPGVVLLHMLGRQRQDWDAFARQLQDAGYGVIAIDFRGHGESEGKREWSKMTMDAAIATDFIRSRPEIDPDRIVLLGASIGANIAINYAAQDPEIVGVALLSPGLDYHGVKTEEAVRQYGARPLFIAASSEDAYAVQSARKLDSLAQGPHQLLILDNQGHGTQMLGKDNGLEEALFQWLTEVTAQ